MSTCGKLNTTLFFTVTGIRALLKNPKRIFLIRPSR